MEIIRRRGPAVTVSATADDWRFYPAENLEQEQERDFAAIDINHRLAELISFSDSEESFDKEALRRLLKSYGYLGADQQCVRDLADELVERVYAKP